jgi:hypothetical protein
MKKWKLKSDAEMAMEYSSVYNPIPFKDKVVKHSHLSHSERMERLAVEDLQAGLKSLREQTQSLCDLIPRAKAVKSKSDIVIYIDKKGHKRWKWKTKKGAIYGKLKEVI